MLPWGVVLRQTEIWRSVIDKRTGNVVGEELLTGNCALVTYQADESGLVDVVE